MATAPPKGSFLCVFHFEIPMMFCEAGQAIIMLDSEDMNQSNTFYINHIFS